MYFLLYAAFFAFLGRRRAELGFELRALHLLGRYSTT
jgi:hypothetical protein